MSDEDKKIKLSDEAAIKIETDINMCYAYLKFCTIYHRKPDIIRVSSNVLKILTSKSVATTIAYSFFQAKVVEDETLQPMQIVPGYLQ